MRPAKIKVEQMLKSANLTKKRSLEKAIQVYNLILLHLFSCFTNKFLKYLLYIMLYLCRLPTCRVLNTSIQEELTTPFSYFHFSLFPVFHFLLLPPVIDDLGKYILDPTLMESLDASTFLLESNWLTMPVYDHLI